MNSCGLSKRFFNYGLLISEIVETFPNKEFKINYSVPK